MATKSKKPQMTQHRLSKFHVRLEGKVDDKLSSLVDELQKGGYVPAIRAARDQITTMLQPFSLPMPTFLSTGVEDVLTCEATGEALIIRRTNEDASRRSRASFVDFAVLTPPTRETADHGFISRIEELLDAPVVPNSFREAKLSESVSEKLGDLSQNGKLLTDPAIRTACRTLSDDGLREVIVPVVSAFQDSPVRRTDLERLEVFSGSEERIDSFIKNTAVLGATFAITCQGCGLTQLFFPERPTAEAALNSAGARCGSCGENKLGVAETYSVRSEFVRAVRQGLWLESLVADLVSDDAARTWIGQMVESDEVDVLAVFADKIVLFECKDTSFGQNDLYVTLAKSQNVQADLVVIVTTRDIHQNVQGAIDRATAPNPDDYRRRSRRRIEVITAVSANQIREKLADIVRDESARALRSTLAGDGFFYPYEFEI